MPTPLDLAALVNAGVAWLHEHKPGWLDTVDTTRLAVDSHRRCPLAQAYGQPFDEAVAAAGLSPAESTALGFYDDDDHNREPGASLYPALTEAWQAAIHYERAERGPR